jgi:hypothetical protein
MEGSKKVTLNLYNHTEQRYYNLGLRGIKLRKVKK